MKRLQRVPELHTVNSRVKDTASLEDLDATITDDFIAAPFPRLAQGLAQSIPLLAWEEGARLAWQSAVLKVTLLTGTRPVALLTPSAGERSRSVGVLMASRITYCFSYFLIHRPEIPP